MYMYTHTHTHTQTHTLQTHRVITQDKFILRRYVHHQRQQCLSLVA